ncbi:hypothetical protein PR048_032532 [Dryococelus australis]|uniref:Uncharacterized protein n=1 Tax=Dryococelus australis TaxID=614101 RepID=A0ABQ9G6M1_9NEOP|nr:hypothetical protein PR048_032532 [Dryococelus australis]
MQRRGKCEDNREKTRRPTAQSGTIPTCENPAATPPGRRRVVQPLLHRGPFRRELGRSYGRPQIRAPRYCGLRDLEDVLEGWSHALQSRLETCCDILFYRYPRISNAVTTVENCAPFIKVSDQSVDIPLSRTGEDNTLPECTLKCRYMLNLVMNGGDLSDEIRSARRWFPCCGAPGDVSGLDLVWGHLAHVFRLREMCAVRALPPQPCPYAGIVAAGSPFPAVHTTIRCSRYETAAYTANKNRKRQQNCVIGQYHVATPLANRRLFNIKPPSQPIAKLSQRPLANRNTNPVPTALTHSLSEDGHKLLTLWHGLGSERTCVRARAGWKTGIRDDYTSLRRSGGAPTLVMSGAWRRLALLVDLKWGGGGGQIAPRHRERAAPAVVAPGFVPRYVAAELWKSQIYWGKRAKLSTLIRPVLRGRMAWLLIGLGRTAIHSSPRVYQPRKCRPPSVKPRTPLTLCRLYLSVARAKLIWKCLCCSEHNSHGCAVFVRPVFKTTSQEHDSALGSSLVDDQPIMNAVKYRVVSGVVWTNRTMMSSNTDTNRTGVLAVVDTGDSLLICLKCQEMCADLNVLTAGLRTPLPSRRTGWIFARGSHTEQCRWLAGFLGDIPLRPCIRALLHIRLASPSPALKDHDVKSPLRQTDSRLEQAAVSTFSRKRRVFPPASFARRSRSSWLRQSVVLAAAGRGSPRLRTNCNTHDLRAPHELFLDIYVRQSPPVTRCRRLYLLVRMTSEGHAHGCDLPCSLVGRGNMRENMESRDQDVRTGIRTQVLLKCESKALPLRHLALLSDQAGRSAKACSLLNNVYRASTLKEAPWDMRVTERGNEEIQSSVLEVATIDLEAGVQTTPKVVKGTGEDMLQDGIDSCDSVGLEFFECVRKERERTRERERERKRERRESGEGEREKLFLACRRILKIAPTRQRHACSRTCLLFSVARVFARVRVCVCVRTGARQPVNKAVHLRDVIPRTFFYRYTVCFPVWRQSRDRRQLRVAIRRPNISSRPEHGQRLLHLHVHRVKISLPPPLNPHPSILSGDRGTNGDGCRSCEVPVPARLSPRRSGRRRWSEGFLRDLPFSAALSFRRCSILTSITLIGSQDLNDGNTVRLVRRSDEALGVRVIVARIAPSLLGLERAGT